MPTVINGPSGFINVGKNGELNSVVYLNGGLIRFSKPVKAYVSGDIVKVLGDKVDCLIIVKDGGKLEGDIEYFEQVPSNQDEAEEPSTSSRLTL